MVDKEEWLNNRERKRRPKLGQGWCQCDRAIVAANQKCPACGRKEIRRRNKKD